MYLFLGFSKRPNALGKAKSAAEEKVEKDALLKGNVKRAAVLETAVITGVLGSQQQAMDVKIEQFSMSVYGKEFIKETCELHQNRYPATLFMDYL